MVVNLIFFILLTVAAYDKHIIGTVFLIFFVLGKISKMSFFNKMHEAIQLTITKVLKLQKKFV